MMLRPVREYCGNSRCSPYPTYRIFMPNLKPKVALMKCERFWMPLDAGREYPQFLTAFLILVLLPKGNRFRLIGDRTGGPLRR